MDVQPFCAANLSRIYFMVNLEVREGEHGFVIIYI